MQETASVQTLTGRNKFLSQSSSVEFLKRSREERPGWEEVGIMKWDQAQSSLIWKERCPFVPLFSFVSPPGRRGTRYPDALLRVFTHTAYKMEVSTQSSVLLLFPLPPVCMQVTESIPNAMTRFPSALPSPLLGFSLSFIAFR